MTMRKLIWSALAATLLLAGGSAARAQDDTFRLGGPSAQADIQGGTDIELVRGYGGGYRGGYHGGGGYGRGYYGGGYARGYGGYGRGYYGGYGYGRGYYAGYGRGYYGGYGYGRGYYGGYYPGIYANFSWPFYGGYGGYGGGYSSPYYYTPTYYQPYYSDEYYYPTSGGVYGEAAKVLGAMNNPSALSTRLLPFSSDGTYSYNGGPQAIVPSTTVPVNNAPRGNVLPLDGKLVGLQSEISGGFSPVTSPEIQRLRFVTPTSTATPVRIQYPAYGEQ
jgi:hypothetical protein